jgi:hypothetical protein
VAWREAGGRHRRTITANGVRLIATVEPAHADMWYWSVRADAGPDMGGLWLAPPPPGCARHRAAEDAKAAADAWIAGFAGELQAEVRRAKREVR